MNQEDITKYRDEEMPEFASAEDATAYYLYSLVSSIDKLTKAIKEKQ